MENDPCYIGAVLRAFVAFDSELRQDFLDDMIAFPSAGTSEKDELSGNAVHNDLAVLKRIQDPMGRPFRRVDVQPEESLSGASESCMGCMAYPHSRIAASKRTVTIVDHAVSTADFSVLERNIRVMA